jgi:hypothetical protein
LNDRILVAQRSLRVPMLNRIVARFRETFRWEARTRHNAQNPVTAF